MQKLRCFHLLFGKEKQHFIEVRGLMGAVELRFNGTEGLKISRLISIQVSVDASIEYFLC